MCKFCVDYTSVASYLSVHSEEVCPFKLVAAGYKRKAQEAVKSGPQKERKWQAGDKTPREAQREAARQRRREGDAMVAEWGRQNRLPEGISVANRFKERLCLPFSERRMPTWR